MPLGGDEGCALERRQDSSSRSTLGIALLGRRQCIEVMQQVTCSVGGVHDGAMTVAAEGAIETAEAWALNSSPRRARRVGCCVKPR